MTWTPTDFAALGLKNVLSLLKVLDAGRRIYLTSEGGESFYRFDNIDSDWDDNIPDGWGWVDEIMWLVRDGLAVQVDGELAITDAGRAHLKENG